MQRIVRKKEQDSCTLPFVSDVPLVRRCPPVPLRYLQESGIAMATTLTINGTDHTVDLDENTPLLWVLRNDLDLTGTKFGCGLSQCGACTVHIDGEAARSCVTPISQAAGKKIVTIEGLAPEGQLTVLQQAWIEEQAPQCGYCQSGQIMTASALLAKNPNPSDAEIIEAMSGNLCRCGTYTRILAAIKKAAASGSPLEASPVASPEASPAASTGATRG